MRKSITSLRNASWIYVLQRLLGCFLVGVFLLLLIGDREAKIILKVLLIGTFFGTLLLKYVLEVPAGLRRTSSAYRAGDGLLRSVIIFQPPEFVAIARLQGQLAVGFLNWITRRPPPAPFAGEPIGFLQRSSYPTLLIILLLAAVTEIPFSFFVLGATNLDPEIISRLHIFIGQLTIISLILVCGDRWLTLHSQHHLIATGLHVRMGARTTGFIPVSAIQECRAIDHRERSSLRSPILTQGDTVWITPFDKPNFHIELKPGNSVCLSHFMLDRRELRHVLLYVEDPSALQHIIRTAL